MSLCLTETFFISVNTLVLEYEYTHLCTIQDKKIFILLLYIFQNHDKIKAVEQN